jgi:hypothetical protein
MQAQVLERNKRTETLSKEPLLKLHNVMIDPSLLYGCETWILRAVQIRREAAEM